MVVCFNPTDRRVLLAESLDQRIRHQTKFVADSSAEDESPHLHSKRATRHKKISAQYPFKYGIYRTEGTRAMVKYLRATCANTQNPRGGTLSLGAGDTDEILLVHLTCIYFVSNVPVTTFVNIEFVTSVCGPAIANCDAYVCVPLVVSTLNLTLTRQQETPMRQHRSSIEPRQPRLRYWEKAICFSSTQIAGDARS